jgi:hypothetical protein
MSTSATSLVRQPVNDGALVWDTDATAFTGTTSSQALAFGSTFNQKGVVISNPSSAGVLYLGINFTPSSAKRSAVVWPGESVSIECLGETVINYIRDTAGSNFTFHAQRWA